MRFKRFESLRQYVSNGTIITPLIVISILSSVIILFVKIMTSNPLNVHTGFLDILYGFATVIIPFYFAIIPFVIAILIDICGMSMDMCKKGFTSWKEFKQKRIDERPMMKIKKSKIGPYILQRGDTDFDSYGTVNNVCKSFVSEQIGRKLNDSETITVLSSQKLADGSLLVIFTYRMCITHENTSPKNKVTSSLQAIRLILNRLEETVHIEHLMTINTESIGLFEDPIKVITATVNDTIPQLSTGNSIDYQIPVSSRQRAACTQ